MTTLESKNDGLLSSAYSTITISANGNFPSAIIEGAGISLVGELRNAYLINPWGTYINMFVEVSIDGIGQSKLEFQAKKIIVKDYESMIFLSKRNNSIISLRFEHDENDYLKHVEFVANSPSVSLTGTFKWNMEWDEETNENVLCGQSTK